ncbi:hypothetical protein Q3G72_015726 [Acer saccharum]|nr:hypothetical protein Q3G72_015726 [Acer saccharum]
MPLKSKSSFKDLVKNRRSVSDSSVFRLKKATNVGGRAFTWLDESFFVSLDDCKIGLVTEGAIGWVTNTSRVESSDCRALAATIISSLAVIVGDYPFAIQALVSLFQAGKLI